MNLGTFVKTGGAFFGLLVMAAPHVLASGDTGTVDDQINGDTLGTYCLVVTTGCALQGPMDIVVSYQRIQHWNYCTGASFDSLYIHFSGAGTGVTVVGNGAGTENAAAVVFTVDGVPFVGSFSLSGPRYPINSLNHGDVSFTLDGEPVTNTLGLGVTFHYSGSNIGTELYELSNAAC